MGFAFASWNLHMNSINASKGLLKWQFCLCDDIQFNSQAFCKQYYLFNDYLQQRSASYVCFQFNKSYSTMILSSGDIFIANQWIRLSVQSCGPFHYYVTLTFHREWLRTSFCLVIVSPTTAYGSASSLLFVPPMRPETSGHTSSPFLCSPFTFWRFSCGKERRNLAILFSTLSGTTSWGCCTCC